MKPTKKPAELPTLEELRKEFNKIKSQPGKDKLAFEEQVEELIEQINDEIRLENQQKAVDLLRDPVTLEELRKEFNKISGKGAQNITSDSPGFWDELSTDEQIAQLEEEIANERNITTSIPENATPLTEENRDLTEEQAKRVPKTPNDKALAANAQKDKNNEKKAPQKFLKIIQKLFSPIKKLFSSVKKLFTTGKSPKSDMQGLVQNAEHARQNAREAISKLKKEQQQFKDRVQARRQAKAVAKAKKIRKSLSVAKNPERSKTSHIQTSPRSRKDSYAVGR